MVQAHSFGSDRPPRTSSRSSSKGFGPPSAMDPHRHRHGGRRRRTSNGGARRSGSIPASSTPSCRLGARPRSWHVRRNIIMADAARRPNGSFSSGDPRPAPHPHCRRKRIIVLPLRRHRWALPSSIEDMFGQPTLATTCDRKSWRSCGALSWLFKAGATSCEAPFPVATTVNKGRPRFLRPAAGHDRRRDGRTRRRSPRPSSASSPLWSARRTSDGSPGRLFHDQVMVEQFGEGAVPALRTGVSPLIMTRRPATAGAGEGAHFLGAVASRLGAVIRDRSGTGDIHDPPHGRRAQTRTGWRQRIDGRYTSPRLWIRCGGRRTTALVDTPCFSVPGGRARGGEGRRTGEDPATTPHEVRRRSTSSMTTSTSSNERWRLLACGVCSGPRRRRVFDDTLSQRILAALLSLRALLTNIKPRQAPAAVIYANAAAFYRHKAGHFPAEVNIKPGTRPTTVGAMSSASAPPSSITSTTSPATMGSDQGPMGKRPDPAGPESDPFS